jgi:hypothetical protein
MEYTHRIYYQEGQQLPIIPCKKHHKLPTRPRPTRPLLDQSWSTLAQSGTHTQPPTSTSWKHSKGELLVKGDYKTTNTTASPLQCQASDGLQDHAQPHSHPSCTVLPRTPLTLGGHGYGLRFHVPFFRTDTMKFSFEPSAIRLWNHQLPQHLATAVTLEAFKGGLVMGS